MATPRQRTARGSMSAKRLIAPFAAVAGVGCIVTAALLANAHSGATTLGGGATSDLAEVSILNERRRVTVANNLTLRHRDATVNSADGVRYSDGGASSISGDDDVSDENAPATFGFYVVSLQDVEGSDPVNAGRLDAFRSSWKDTCGKNGIDFTVCPGTLHPNRGFGITQSFVNCFDTAATSNASMAFFFEDDARLFNSDFCRPSFRERLLRDLPEDLYLLLLGGHRWRSPANQTGEAWDKGFARIRHSYGAFGFALTQPGIGRLHSSFASYLERGQGYLNESRAQAKNTNISRPTLKKIYPGSLSPDIEWFAFAQKDRRTIYATTPLIVKHAAGYSNTWKTARDMEMGANPFPFGKLGGSDEPVLVKRTKTGGAIAFKTKHSFGRKPALGPNDEKKHPEKKAAGTSSRLQRMAGQTLRVKPGQP